jgi:integrase
MMVILSNQKYDHAGRRQCESRRSQTNGLEQRQVDWGKGPSAAKHVWSIRTKLQIEGRTRDLAIFNLAIDSKLRGCDVVALKVDDIAPHGCAVDRATVRQKRTGIPVRFEITEQTPQAVDDYVRTFGKKSCEFLFGRHRRPGQCMSTRQYARLVSDWVRSMQHWARSQFVWHAFTPPYQGHFDLSPNRKPTCGTTIAWTPKN